MTTKDLIPLNQRTKEDARRIQVMGGKAKSAKKALSSRINGLMNSGKVSDDVKQMLKLLQQGKMSELLTELTSMDLQDSEEDVKRRDHAIDTILRSQPQRVVSMNINKEVFDDDLFNVDEHLKKILGKED